MATLHVNIIAIVSSNDYNIDTMAKKIAPLLPATEARLREFGDRLRVARLRRRLLAKQVAERAGMAPMTLRSLERGGSGVTMGAYLAVMQVLGLDKDLDLLARADSVGRELQDARLPTRSKTTAPPPPAAAKNAAAPENQISVRERDSQRWSEKSGFLSSQTLAELLKPPASASKNKRR